jgi:hypothetical protein
MPGSLSMVATTTSAVYGAVDIGTEYLDQAVLKGMGAPGTFKNTTDWQRAIAAVGGGFVASGMLTKKKSITEMANNVHLASIPLLEKSIVNFILIMTKSTSPFRARGRGQIQIRNPGAGGASSGGVVY